MIRQKMMVGVLSLGLIGACLFGASSLVSAQTNQNTPTIIQKIAQKFNLNEADVKAVFDEERASHQAERKAALETKLTENVKNGKITETQKNAILEKFAKMHEEKQAYMGNFKNLSPDQRRAAMENMREEMESWASQNGLTLDTLHELMGGMRGGHRGGFMR